MEKLIALCKVEVNLSTDYEAATRLISENILRVSAISVGMSPDI